MIYTVLETTSFNARGSVQIAVSIKCLLGNKRCKCQYLPDVQVTLTKL